MLLGALMHIYVLIHLVSEGHHPLCHKARLNVNHNVISWEMAAHHVRDTLSGVCVLFWNSVFSPTVPGACLCAYSNPTFSFSVMRRQTEEMLCMERIKRNGIEKKGGAKEVVRKGAPHGERSCQSLGDIKRTTALWSACTLALLWQLPDSSVLARTYTRMLLLETTRALFPHWLINSYSNTFKFHGHKHSHVHVSYT